jgi:hypothetical protein
MQACRVAPLGAAPELSSSFGSTPVAESQVEKQRMADGHPYISGGGALVQIVEHLRRTFPPVLNADTLKKLAVASNNESYLINILRFIAVIDDEGKKTSAATKVFSKHDDAEFAKAFGDLVKTGYKDLFALHGDGSWQLPSNKLISFFRSTDESSAVVGQRQTTTFQTLAALAGHGEAPRMRLTPGKTAQVKTSTKGRKEKGTSPSRGNPAPQVKHEVPNPSGTDGARDIGLTVRVEINLPSGADKDTYDLIFKSIRENLLNG